ncbi:MAG: DUF1015 family protein [Bacteroidetes bacterium]|nr:DUF1015 family protein [Bacteroidota bacterium]MCY4234166.1 DUF1015 family protein [Bacteroidota bacterium]
MAKIKAFSALRPTHDSAKQVASVPYDVISIPEARELARGNPQSFLHIIRPEIDLPSAVSEYDDAVYAKGAENLKQFAAAPYSHQETQPAIYAYQLRMGDHHQVGVYGLVSVDDYKVGHILKHENVRPPKVADRTRHIQEQSAHSEPVMLVFRDSDAVTKLINECTLTDPLFDFTAEDGIQHTIWKFANSEQLVDAFSQVDPMYIADGHHRCEAAWKVWNDGNIPGSDYFPAVCFPVSSTQILPYNRVVRVGDIEKLIQDIESLGILHRVTNQATPQAQGEVCMFAQGQWHTIALPESERQGIADQLDVARLGEFILEPFLRITDQRTDPNITFVGGIRGTHELEERVKSTSNAVAFSMYPTSMNQLIDVSDAHELMPPKSTWFEPKLRSGLLIHLFGNHESSCCR